MKHSSLPWLVNKRSSPDCVWSADNVLVVRYAGGRTSEEAENNAALIARAVNCHDELLEALQNITDWLDDGNRILSDACAVDVSKARAAIKKARGEE